MRTTGQAPLTRRGRRRRGGEDNLTRVFVLGASALKFRGDLALVANASTQLPVTPQTSVCPCVPVGNTFLYYHQLQKPVGKKGEVSLGQLVVLWLWQVSRHLAS